MKGEEIWEEVFDDETDGERWWKGGGQWLKLWTDEVRGSTSDELGGMDAGGEWGGRGLIDPTPERQLTAAEKETDSIDMTGSQRSWRHRIGLTERGKAEKEGRNRGM